MRVSESSGDFVGRLWTVSDGNQPTLSSLLSTDSSMRTPRTIFLPQSERRGESKQKGHIFYLCGKSAVKKRRAGRRERGVSLYPSVDIIPSMRINSPRQREMRKERAQDGGRELGGRRAEMVVVLILQRNTALSVLLKRSHKPELSGWAGACWHLATPT